MRTIAFFSTASELDILEKRKDFKELKLIALSPKADAALSKYPEKRNTIEDYYSESDLNRLGNDSLQKIQEICNFIDEHYIHAAQFFSCSDVYMFIKILYDQLLINHTFCHAILMRENPEKVLLFKTKNCSSSLFVSQNDDLVSHFIHYFFYVKHHIACDILPSIEKFSQKNKVFQPMLFLRNKLSYFKFKGENQIYRFLNFKKSPIYMLQHYEFESCKNLRTFFKLYWDNRKNTEFQYEPKMKNHLVDNDKRKILDTYFSFDGLEYVTLIEQKLIFLMEGLPPFFDGIVIKYRSIFAKKKIKAVIASSGQSLDILAGIKAAHLLKIPVIWGQHGGFYGYASFPLIDYLHKNYTHYFLYTDSISVINNHKNCFSVSNGQLLKIYKTKRHAH